jgi:hypothetical protein
MSAWPEDAFDEFGFSNLTDGEAIRIRAVHEAASKHVRDNSTTVEIPSKRRRLNPWLDCGFDCPEMNSPRLESESDSD